MESKQPILTKRDYFITSIRSYLLQSAFNYTAYQGVSYLNVIFPALRKIYHNDQAKLKEVATANLEFYNTNPHMVPFVTNMQLAMYDNGQDVTTARSIKMAMMGPLAGVGDSIAQFGLAPLFSTIFAGLALDGLGFAPMGYWFAMILSLLVLRLSMGTLGYRLGTSAIQSLSDQIGRVSEAASIVGVTVIAGLATLFVKAKIALEYTTILDTGEKQVVAFQTILDKIMPNLLPVLVTILVYYLLKKRNWNTYQLLFLLFGIGIAASSLGILQ
ncbi:PTS system mannose/fructose/sorbose family transporter subunit IID [Testudinibacter aquarius]|uniref:PTS system IID component (Man family) n=1 Tax=Testudinibacter aquarius TaxID=1524974 RepID=A0A4R3YAK7_9PAST|nr:PTS system mannose/fructose/sorbose family transporter subunit IID [Testudinibacter aquarius]KAE9525846.1 PTS N-acetylgalactosamine transporter subunit IID [Testudinibacter aquarius]TCV88782.1 PTS system IID component (Man family) [Testudinibacter aquarius]TNG93462.1 PTS system mannose/fructose/sorbose family transporter subunit IID [Testudinibacter aquarius]